MERLFIEVWDLTMTAIICYVENVEEKLRLRPKIPSSGGHLIQGVTKEPRTTSKHLEGV